MRAGSGFDVRAARRHVRHSILERLPDIPRWVEVRSLLLAGDGEIFGLDEGHDLSVAVRDPSTGSVVVVGRPAPESVEAAVGDMMHDGSLIAAPENADWLARLLPAWHRTRAILHTLRDPTCLPPESTDVGFPDPDAIDRLSILDQLRRELRIGAEDSPIAATFVDERPVSFCYAGSVTESWWDVAIDTLRSIAGAGTRRHPPHT